MSPEVFVVTLATIIVLGGLAVLGLRRSAPEPPHFHSDYLACLNRECYKAGDPIPDFVDDERLRPRTQADDVAIIRTHRGIAETATGARKRPAAKRSKRKTTAKKTQKKKTTRRKA